MPLSIRLKNKEMDGLEKASLKLNRVLIDKGIQPVSIADMVHLFIEKGVEDSISDPEQVSTLYYRKLENWYKWGDFSVFTVNSGLLGKLKYLFNYLRPLRDHQIQALDL